MSKAAHRWSSKLHKWLALVVGVQLLLWTVSGLFMTIWPIEQVRGEHMVRGDGDLFVDAPLVMPDLTRSVASSAVLRPLRGRAALVVEESGRKRLYDPYSGGELSAPDEAAIRSAAGYYYTGEGKIADIRLIAERPPLEYRGPLPVWQVRFDDPQQLRLYLDPATGEVVTRRTRLWRVYDFMWMLHIMDYDTREDTSNWLLRIAASLGVTVALSGLLLLVYRLIRPAWRRRTAR